MYELPARITSYEESEAFIMDQAHSDTFLAHLQRLVAPLAERLDKLSGTDGGIREEDILSVVPSLRRAVQEATISFKTLINQCYPPQLARRQQQAGLQQQAPQALEFLLLVH